VIGLDEARHIIGIAEQAATRSDQPQNIAVVDAGGHLIAHVRMDGARRAGAQIAIDKAWTAAVCEAATADFAVTAAPGGPLYGLEATHGGRLVIIGGGVPLRRDGVVVGGIGVSGGTADQDVAVAEAGAAALAQRGRAPSDGHR
jgi:uncharacterized protein GlcG (DUF336 family)